LTTSDLDRAGAHFPLGLPLPPARSGVTAMAPFGLLRAVPPSPSAVVDVDWSAIGFDPSRQIAVIVDDGTVLPAMKHTSTQTKTSTNSHDRNPPDDDKDATGT
jgi:putative ATP-grasp target RiPP